MGFELQPHGLKPAGGAGEEDGEQGDGTGRVVVHDECVRKVSVPYTKCKDSLMWTQYDALFFTAIKK